MELATSSTVCTLEDKLCSLIERLDSKKIEKLLAEGANATLVASNGRSPIGFAVTKGARQILQILLKSCEEPVISSPSELTEVGRRAARPDREYETRTPDGMENLQWEEEIQGNSSSSDDEWSRLYIYYAHMIEKTGAMLANTVKMKDPHCLDGFNHAPIHYAAMLGDAESIEILLHFHSPVDICTNSGFTPLHLGVEHTQVVQLLLQHKANPNKRIYQNQETPLHIAARVGNPHVVPLLLEAGADINATCTSDRTPLILALASKNLEVARAFIHHGAKINIEDAQGLTPLYISIIINNIPIAEHLMRKGARLYMSHYSIHYCIRKNMLPMLKVLITYGDNINLREESSGYTPLLLAIAEQNVQIIKCLIEYNVELNREDYAMKELHVTIQECQMFEQFKQIAQILLCSGVNIDNCNYWGGSPLHHAIMLEKYQMAEYLLKQGANVNSGCLDRYVDTFVLARQAKNVNLLKIMVNVGLTVHSKQKSITLKPPPWLNEDCMEDYLGWVCSNPLSLQQITRIVIRNRLIATINSRHYFTLNSNCYENFDFSILKYLIRQLALPKLIERYLYEFPDVPLVSSDRSSALPFVYTNNSQDFIS